MSFWYLQFSQKANEKIPLYYYGTSSRIVFVRFLGELKIPKRHFEINWPVPESRNSLYYFHTWFFLNFRCKLLGNQYQYPVQPVAIGKNASVRRYSRKNWFWKQWRMPINLLPRNERRLVKKMPNLRPYTKAGRRPQWWPKDSKLVTWMSPNLVRMRKKKKYQLKKEFLLILILHQWKRSVSFVDFRFSKHNFCFRLFIYNAQRCNFST